MSSRTIETYRVGLNALLLHSGQASYRRAGIHSYVNGLLPHLAPADDRLAYTAYVSKGKLPVNSRTHIYQVGPAIARPALRIAWEQLVQPWVSIREQLDLLHSMAFVSPILAPTPTVVTVYDLSFLKVPNRFRAANQLYLSMFTKLSCLRARRVIAISESTKGDVVTHYGIPPELIDVIYPGLDPKFCRATVASVAEFRARRGLPEKFILYLGTIEPRKNLSVLINAFAKVQPAGVKLICVGGKGWMYQDVFQTVEELHLSRDVIFPGFMPIEELPLWYSAAMAFVYPSSYEGFGIPVMEALACGVPTITTSSSSLPEVAGAAACLVPPDDIDTLAEVLSQVLTDATLRAELAAAGPLQARKFCWATAGCLTAGTYARALGLPDLPLVKGESHSCSAG